MAKVLYRMGRSAALHPLRTLALWIVVAALVLGAKGSMGGALSDKFTIPGAESQDALDLLKDRFPSESHASGDLVFHVQQGRVTDPGPSATIAAALRSLQSAPHVTAVSNPFDAAEPTVNLVFFFVGVEEAGSPPREALLQDNLALIDDVDVWLSCDGPSHQSGRMQLVFGVRGVTGFEITVFGPARPLHAGELSLAVVSNRES